MKRLIIALVAGLVTSIPVWAGGGKSYRYTYSSPAWVWVDTVAWSNNHGLGTSLRDTLKGASDKDTSTVIDLAGIQAFTAMIIASGAQGTAGGTHAVTCSLEVSLDGTNWSTGENWGIPVWSYASSLGTTPVRDFLVYYASEADTTARRDAFPGLPGPAAKGLLQGVRLGRFKVTQASGAADSTFLTIVTYRQFK